MSVHNLEDLVGRGLFDDDQLTTGQLHCLGIPREAAEAICELYGTWSALSLSGVTGEELVMLFGKKKKLLAYQLLVGIADGRTESAERKLRMRRQQVAADFTETLSIALLAAIVLVARVVNSDED